MNKSGMKNLLLILVLLLPINALAGEEVHLDKAPVNLDDQASLQRGAKTFVNYCLNCHSAVSMRYNRLQDIGLTEAQIKANLLFAGEKVGDTMTVAMNAKEAAAWFGAPPPDLSVIARARGADWLYTYMRGFYRDDTRPTGWNNKVFDKVGMPHALYDQQAKLKPAEYDAMVADLVNYMVFMGEPAKLVRGNLGLIVLVFLSVFFVLARALKKEFWKDIH
jgi:ubiquinol-cytochrome c reductase cytochrome c1 subunit